MSTITDTDSDTDASTEHTQDAFTVGDVVADREADTDGEPVVVNLPPVAAREWTAYRTDDGDVTVADDNTAYNPEARVVVVMFDEDLDAWGTDWEANKPIALAEAPNGATYAFPPGRLEHTGGRYGKAGDTADEPTENPDAADDTEATTLRDRLDAIADAVENLNVDGVAVDTFREAVVVEKLGATYAIDAEGAVDSDDPLAQRLEDAVAESPEVSAE